MDEEETPLTIGEAVLQIAMDRKAPEEDWLDYWSRHAAIRERVPEWQEALARDRASDELRRWGEDEAAELVWKA